MEMTWSHSYVRKTLLAADVVSLKNPVTGYRVRSLAELARGGCTREGAVGACVFKRLYRMLSWDQEINSGSAEQL